ncbi:MAG: CHAT domain-containing protein [Candidatus Azotimanducaceae bacterium]|jgi:CHAT domain-containing protein
MWLRICAVFTYCILSFCQSLTAAPASELNNDSQQLNDLLRNDLLRKASVYQDQGYRSQAIALLQQADQLAHQQGTNQNDTGLLLAQLYFELGEYPLSLNMTTRILDQPQTDGIQARALNILATVQSTLNNPKTATNTFTEAYAASVKSGDKAMTMTILTNHLRHELDHKKSHEALKIGQQLLPLSKTLENLAEVVEIQISIGDLLIRLADQTAEQNYYQHALVILQQAEATAKTRSHVRLQSYAVGHQGRLLINQGKLEEGIQKLSTANFLASTIRSYESAYLWQWQLARAHRLQGKTDDAITGYQTAITTLEQVRKELINGSPFTFPQKIQPLFSELSDLLLTAARESQSHNHQQNYLKQVQAVLEQSKSAELQDYFQNDCVVPDQAVDLNRVDVATAVIYPVILADRLEILVNIGDQVHQFVHQIRATDLERMVNDFRDNLQRDQGDDEYKEIGEELYELVFAEAESVLQEKNIETLLVIPDGILRTIPFAAIYDGNEFMIQKYALATTPGISLTLPKRLDVAQSTLFAAGISHSVQGFSSLPGVPVELNKLQERYGAEVLHNEEFQRTSIQDQLGSEDYSIVHIATHGHFDSNPQESYLLTYDDKLTLDLLEQSIGSRRQSGNPLELLVLSACETAVGDNRAALGLAGVALKAGARSAIATLWQISDEATVLIIDSFYEHTSSEHLSKAQALRIAQNELIDSERFSHPTDWAPFLLIGNWL